jgi:hypothetical protein
MNKTAQTFRFKQIGIALVLSALAASSGVPALARTSAKVEPIEVLPIQDSVGEVDTVKSTLTMTMDGNLSRNTKTKIKGTMTINLTSDAASKRNSFVMTGDLLQSLGALGAGASSGIKFKEMGFYTIEDKSYLYMDAGQKPSQKICMDFNVEVGGVNVMAEAFKPEALLGSMGNDEDTQYAGEFVREEKINGINTKRYKLDAATMQKLNAKSKSSNRFKGKMTKGELWVAVDGNYLVRISQEGSGTITKLFQQQDYTGKFAVQYDILAVNKKVNVALPKSCDKPLKLPGG